MGYYEDMSAEELIRIVIISMKLVTVRINRPGYPVAGRAEQAIEALLAFIAIHHPSLLKAAEAAQDDVLVD